MSEISSKQPISVNWSASLSDLTLALLYDCFILLSTIFDVLKIILCFVYHITGFLYTLTYGVVSSCVYYATCVTVHFARGILGLEDKPTSAFCWLLAIFVMYFYCDQQYHSVFTTLSRGVSTLQHLVRSRRLHSTLFFRHAFHNQPALQHENTATVVLENQRNEEAEIEPINRQLEAQNVLNENEENFLVEADHRRVLNDNRHNVALENGADSQRARIENRQNVERECHNTQTSLENRRNCTQERQRYFLRQRRSLPALYNPAQPDERLEPVAANGVARALVLNDHNYTSHQVSETGSGFHDGLEFGQSRHGFPNREGGLMLNQF